jgi:hypothetical protein
MNSKKISLMLGAIVACSIFIIGTALLMYVRKFGKAGLSDSQEVWGQFGDFLGGLANPLLSFLTLMGLILTVYLQSKQLELSKNELQLSRLELTSTRAELEQSRIAAQEQVAHVKSEAKKADVYRTIQVLESRLEGLYREPIYIVANGRLIKRELYFALTFFTPESLKLIIEPDTLPSQQFDFELTQTKSVLTQLHLTIVKMSMQLTFLVEIGDCDSVLFFYEPTLMHLARKLKEIGYLPEPDELTIKMGSEIRQSIKSARMQAKNSTPHATNIFS